VRLRYDHGERDYKGPLPGFMATSRQDTLDLVSLAFEWQPVRAVKMTLSVQQDKRKSTETGLDYKSNGINLGVEAGF
jgi:hypothetical protein